MAKKPIDAKKLTADEVRRLSDEEIPIVLGQLRDKLFALKTQTASEKVEDTSQFGVIKRAVARVKTERRRRQIERRGSEHMGRKHLLRLGKKADSTASEASNA
ncbi:MAG: 50S ribosomal protein L29 [Planctomycetota bacterium]